MSINKFYAGIIVLFVFVVAGCSTGVPVTPNLDGTAKFSREESGSMGQVLFGMWEIEFIPDIQQFEIVPLRGLEFQANVTRFLQPPTSPINLLSVNFVPGQSDFPSGHVVCDVTVKHPFPGLPQFRGFDVRGIVMGNGTWSANSSTGEILPKLNELRLKNADGYSRWWNPTEFTTYGKIFGYTPGKLAPQSFFANATVNGYKYFSDDLDATENLTGLDLSKRGSFTISPGLNTRRYDIQFPLNGVVPDFRFNYAITASYMSPVNGAPNFELETYPISANMPEAFLIKVADTGSTAYYENSSTYGGDLKLEIEVFDWQIGFKGDFSEDIAEITIESPTLFPGLEVIDIGSGVPGSTEYSWKFPVEISGVTPSGVANQEILIRIVSSTPESYAPDIPGVTGFDYPDVPIAAYFIYVPEISNFAPSDEDCPSEIHTEFSEYYMDGIPSQLYVKEDVTFQTKGQYAGYALVPDELGHVRAYDTSQPSPWTGEDYIQLQSIFNENDLVQSIDVDDYSGRVILSMMNKDAVLDPSLFEIYDVDGNFLKQFSVGQYKEFCVADTEEDGTLWIQVWENPHDGKEGNAWMQRWTYLPEEPYYTISDGDQYDISTVITANNELWDMAISYEDDRIFGLRGNYGNDVAPYGELHVWDILGDGSISYNESLTMLQVFPDEVQGSYTTYHGTLVSGDIEIDHSFKGTEPCRVIVMARRKMGGGHYFGLFDTDLNQIDMQLVGPTDHRYAFSIRQDSDVSLRSIITAGYSPAKVWIGKAPPGW